MSKRARPEPSPLTHEVTSALRAEMGRRRDLTQGDLAKAVDISAAQLSDILNDKKQIDLDLLDRLCFALSLDFKATVGEADVRTRDRRIAPEWDTPTL